jgi:ABC-type protease/lipase transport system fused ATPase/permease subunit
MIFAVGISTHPDLPPHGATVSARSRSVALFSGVVNLLMLVSPLYMLQIYDRS